MALLHAIVSITIEDGDGEIFAVPIYGNLDDTATVTDLAVAVSDLVGIVDAVIDGKIVKVGVKIEFALPGGIKTDPVAGSETERTGLYNFDADSTIYDFGVDVPAMALSTLVSGTNQIDPANTNVAAFVSAMTTGLSPFFPTNKYGNNLTALRGARKTFRKHRRSTKLH